MSIRRLMEVICDGCQATGGVVPLGPGRVASGFRLKLFNLGWRRRVTKWDPKSGKDWCPSCVQRKRERSPPPEGGERQVFAIAPPAVLEAAWQAMLPPHDYGHASSHCIYCHVPLEAVEDGLVIEGCAARQEYEQQQALELEDQVQRAEGEGMVAP